MSQRVLTGIQPSGTPHLGNYLGMIRPALALADRFECLYLIADAHALTTVRDPHRLRSLSMEVTAVWLALGLDPSRSVLYRQSDLPEVFELSWILSCCTPKGMLNRGHAYKSAVETNRIAGRADDFHVNAGTYNYPVLMAADIFLLDADLVLVGEDNRQHVEIARDLALRANNLYGTRLKPPEGLIDEGVASIIGLDGREMSKSYDNVIPIFAEPSEMRRLVMRIVTDSRAPEEPKDPEKCNVFSLYRHFASSGDIEVMRQRYLSGGVGYAEVKETLLTLLVSTFEQPRQRFLEFLADPEFLERVLAEGAQRVVEEARDRVEQVRTAVGIARLG